MLGRENIFNFWCMWCNHSKCQWTDNLAGTGDPRTINQLKDKVKKNDKEKPKLQQQIMGVTGNPIWQFTEVDYFYTQFYIMKSV